MADCGGSPFKVEGVVGTTLLIDVPEDAERVDVYISTAQTVGWSRGDGDTAPVFFSAGSQVLNNLLKPPFVTKLAIQLVAPGIGYISWTRPSKCACKGG